MKHIIEKDGKKYKAVDVGRGRIIWKEVKPSAFRQLLNLIFKK